MLLQTTLIIRLVTRGLLSEEDVLSLVDTTLLSLENLKDAERQSRRFAVSSSEYWSGC